MSDLAKTKKEKRTNEEIPLSNFKPFSDEFRANSTLDNFQHFTVIGDIHLNTGSDASKKEEEDKRKR